MRYKVPQKIDMEDRIVGPLTLTQFLYVMIGGMLIYAFYQAFFLTGRQIIFWLLAAPVGLFSTSMAFLKIQEEPLPRFLIHTLLFFTRAKQRVWMKENTNPIQGKIFIDDKKTTVKPRTDTKIEAKEKIKNITDILDR